PYHRAQQPAASPEDRLAMIRRAVADNPHLRASDVDIVRPGPNYSVDTVADVQRELGEGVPLAFIIGWDSLRDIHRWRTPDELARRCRLVAVRRPGASDPNWATLEAAIPNARRRILALDAPLLDISATALRQRVARGWPLRYWTPDAVAAYIEERGLYREG
ncbi:MAG: nicotinate (nicotinamide) nucleotide adenylyltransferase, partial [Chloroflexi bacterium]|nr:nicotinate (nicotinamide) nucleotide adenylyltransferase [Chloroflexota bacterium]